MALLTVSSRLLDGDSLDMFILQGNKVTLYHKPSRPSSFYRHGIALTVLHSYGGRAFYTTRRTMGVDPWADEEDEHAEDGGVAGDATELEREAARRREQVSLVAASSFTRTKRQSSLMAFGGRVPMYVDTPLRASNGFVPGCRRPGFSRAAEAPPRAPHQRRGGTARA